MRRNTVAIALGLALVGGAAHAAGPLYTTDGANPQPYKWDTSRGPIPVWTDGGEAFTFDFDGVTPFITIERANEITQFAFDQWNNVPTSTFQAQVAGTIESQTGIADVTGENAGEIYEVENGYGFWVLYDTDASILEDYFGVPRWAVLGIAFPEWGNPATGEITEATAVINGWQVFSTDVDGSRHAGVFTHEFGHAINLSHTQVNGQMAYYSNPGISDRYPGVAGCEGVEPVHRYTLPAIPGYSNPADPAIIETMYPVIDNRRQAGAEQSTVDHPDDMAAISDIYATPDYHATRGSISGVLRLKDGRTEYSGINVVARNVANPLFDAVSGMTGGLTQGKVGPDGRFVINNLTPGAQYQVYIEQIVTGGFPTTPTMLVSEAEYWNAAESSDPLTDVACDATPITVAAGETQVADITFNGYDKGVSFTPIVAANLTSLAKSGHKAAGVASNTAFLWDREKGFTVLPPELKANHGSMNRNGQRLLVQADPDGNGIQEPVIWTKTGIIPLGDLPENGDTCGGSSQNGKNSASGFALDASGNTAVGFGYRDTDGDGRCQGSFKSEIMPFIWDAKGGMRQLDTSNLDMTQLPWLRAQAISGNGRVVLGNSNLNRAFGWVDEGPAIDLGEAVDARDAYAINYDGSRAALYTTDGVVLWNPFADGDDEFVNIGGLRWCVDLPFTDFFGNDFCDFYTEEELNQFVGKPPVVPIDMTDDGSVIVARGGSFSTGFLGMMWIEDYGWITMNDFFEKQGVIEARTVPFDNPITISASGTEIAGGIAGAQFSWLIEADQVYVCHKGKSILTGFPGGLRSMLDKGAEFGRCEHLPN